MNNELKQLEFENNMNNNINDNFISFQPDQTNKSQVLNMFKRVTQQQNRSIISQTFFILLEIETKCFSCGISKYNYQVTYYLEFPLELVFDYCKQNNIDNYIKDKNNKIRKKVPLYACFMHSIQPSIFSGNNPIYCNICSHQTDASYLNKLYSLPPILIIILDRGKGKTFDCDVDFPQNLDLKNFVQNKINCINEKIIILLIISLFYFM